MNRPKFGQSQTARAVCEATNESDATKGAISLAESFTLQWGVTHAARQLDFLASVQGAKIKRDVLRDAGQLVPLGAGDIEYLILVNQDHPWQKQNFTICHELGHLLMPNYDPQEGRRTDYETMRWNEEQEEEYLCDVVAAEILMPRRIFVPRLRGCGLSISALKELSTEFDSSLEATAINAVRAGLEDVAVVIWKLDYSKKDAASAENLSLFENSADPMLAPVEKKCRIKYGYGHGAMRDFYFPPQKSVANGSLIAQSLQLLAEGKPTRTCGEEVLPHGKGEHKFYIESCAYWVGRDDESEPKVISLVFPEQPTHIS